MASSMAEPSSEQEEQYKIKRIQFFGRSSTPIFMQNVNGPCPLLALVNVLSLRNQLPEIPAGTPSISLKRLIAMVAERLIDSNVGANVSAQGRAFEADLQQNLSDSLDSLHKLAVGMDVNVRFNSVFGFEPTQYVSIFDLLDISLCHGWLVDPADSEAVEVVGSRSYNELIEMIVTTLDAVQEHPQQPAPPQDAQPPLPPPPPPDVPMSPSAPPEVPAVILAALESPSLTATNTGAAPGLSESTQQLDLSASSVVAGAAVVAATATTLVTVAAAPGDAAKVHHEPGPPQASEGTPVAAPEATEVPSRESPSPSQASGATAAEANAAAGAPAAAEQAAPQAAVVETETEVAAAGGALLAGMTAGVMAATLASVDSAAAARGAASAAAEPSVSAESQSCSGRPEAIAVPEAGGTNGVPALGEGAAGRPAAEDALPPFRLQSLDSLQVEVAAPTPETGAQESSAAATQAGVVPAAPAASEADWNPPQSTAPQQQPPQAPEPTQMAELQQQQQGKEQPPALAPQDGCTVAQAEQWELVQVAPTEVSGAGATPAAALSAVDAVFVEVAATDISPPGGGPTRSLIPPAQPPQSTPPPPPATAVVTLETRLVTAQDDLFFSAPTQAAAPTAVTQSAAAAPHGATYPAPAPGPPPPQVDLITFDDDEGDEALEPVAPPPPPPPPPAAPLPPAPSPPPPEPDADVMARRVYDAMVARDFLEASCSQLTVAGLTALQDSLRPSQLAVFFRNNHFSVIFKHGATHQLYLLVTDQGYLTEADVVWEHLSSVAGDTQLCGPDFAPFKPHKEPGPGAAASQGAPGGIEMSEADAAAIAAVLAEDEAQMHGARHSTPDLDPSTLDLSGLDLHNPLAQHQQAPQGRRSLAGGPAPPPPSPPLQQSPPGAQLAYPPIYQQPLAPQQLPAQQQHDLDADLALALRLQEEEELAARQEEERRRRQQQQQQQGQVHGQPEPTGSPQPGQPGAGAWQQERQSQQQPQGRPQAPAPEEQYRGGTFSPAYRQRQQQQQQQRPAGQGSAGSRHQQAPGPEDKDSKCAIM